MSPEIPLMNKSSLRLKEILVSSKTNGCIAILPTNLALIKEVTIFFNTLRISQFLISGIIFSINSDPTYQWTEIRLTSLPSVSMWTWSGKMFRIMVSFIGWHWLFLLLSLVLYFFSFWTLGHTCWDTRRRNKICLPKYFFQAGHGIITILAQKQPNNCRKRVHPSFQLFKSQS